MKGNCDSAIGVRGRLVRAVVPGLCVLFATGSVCFSQTNVASLAGGSAKTQQAAQVQGHLFAPPEFKVHELPIRADDQAVLQTHRAVAFTSRFGPGNDSAQEALFRQIEKEGSLKAPEPMFNSEVGRKIENAFRPEILHVGHVRIYSPLVTAIARKNPLCLIDPVVLNISF